MNVLSLFDGMSCGQIAMKLLNIPIDNYFASEIDKFAIKQTQHNFPNTIQLGDVTKVKAKDLPKIDLLLGGSPCQGFSFAGKQLNFNDPRSVLFFEYVRLLNDIKKTNPDVLFLLENVNMKKEYLRVISEYLGLFPVRINSNRVSAQNRDRWYWTNIKTKDIGLFSELWSDIPQPEDRGIFIKDILQPENEVDSKYYFDGLNVLGIDINGKSPTQRASTGNCTDNKHNYQFIKLDKKLKPKPDQNKASCFTAGGNSGGNHSDMDIICVAMRDQPDNNGNIKQRLEPNNEGKTNCITSVSKDNLLSNGYILRRLTPLECSRLQTIPDFYEWIVSDSQIYKMLGNGWTVEVIKHILSYIKFNQ